MNKWNVGIYIRLSQEDGDKEESNSIKNQLQEDIASNQISMFENIDLFGEERKKKKWLELCK